MKTDFVKDV